MGRAVLDNYSIGFKNLLTDVSKHLPENTLNVTRLQASWQNVTITIVAQNYQAIVPEFSKIIMQFVMCIIYTILMLLHPMEEMSGVFGTVRQYFAWKTVSNLIYTAFTFIILRSIGCSLTAMLTVITFFLSYIPELGAFITCALPVPAILLDGGLDYPYTKAIICLILMIVNKFAVGNGVEAVLMGMGSASNDDAPQVGHTHPVIMIVIVLFGATLWNATGTIFSVPVTWLTQAYVLEQKRRWDILVTMDASERQRNGTASATPKPTELDQRGKHRASHGAAPKQGRSCS
jgi:predicted PurR-regulated permease PerM